MAISVRSHAILALSAVVIAIAVGSLRMVPRSAIPDHMLNGTLFYEKELFSRSTQAALLGLVKRIGRFPCNTEDTRFYVAKHRHIGESVDCDSPEANANPLLVPLNASQKGGACAFPGRVDIGRHWVLTGGPTAIRERFDSMATRVMSFGAYMFDLEKYPEVQQLFSDERFQNAARIVCPDSKSHIDPFQYNFIINLPGQTVATHIDGVYFRRASRFQFPQWLLAAMKFSGMWEDEFVNQVQIVGYVHEWNPDSFESKDASGPFLYYSDNSGQPGAVYPVPRSGTAVDGSSTIHAAGVYRPDELPPRIDVAYSHWLSYEGGDSWSLKRAPKGESDNGETLRMYTTSDLRISIVYRARCFEDDATAAQYASNVATGTFENSLTLQEVLETFFEDLKSKGFYAQSALENVPRSHLATDILKTYVKYPLPRALVPWNYCALGKLMPALSPAVSLIC